MLFYENLVVGDGVSYTPVKMMDDVIWADGNGNLAAAVTSDGSLWMWGMNLPEALNGKEPEQYTYTPVEERVKVLENVVQVSVSSLPNFALTATGDLYLWGPNALSFLGYQPDGPVKFLDNVSQFDAWSNSIGIIKNDGSLWMAGSFAYGSCGNGSEYGVDEPVKVLDDAAQVSLGEYVSSAVATDGTLYTWGSNGIAGMGKVEGDMYVPTAVQEGIRAVSIGSGCGGFIKDDGSLWMWGFGRDGCSGSSDNPLVPHEILTTMHAGGSGEDPDSDSPITVTGSTENVSNCDFKLGGNVEISIPKKMPFVGGGKIKLDFGNVPVQLQREGNTYRFGFGVDDLVELIDSGGWQTYKKFVEKQNEKLADGIAGLDKAKKYPFVASKAFKVDPEMSVFGYAEATVDGDGIHSVGGHLSMKMNAKGTKEWQSIVVVVPVVFTFKGDIGYETEVSLDLNTDESEFYLDGSLDLTLPKIKLTGGVGVAWVADVSVYGSARNGVFIQGGENAGYTASLEGEVGARARALCFEYEKALLNGKVDYFKYPEDFAGRSQDLNASTVSSLPLLDLSDDQDVQLNSISTEDGWFGIDRSSASKWYTNKDPLTSFFDLFSDGAASAGSNELQVLQEAVYSGAEPKLIQTSSGAKVLVFTQDVSDRTSANHTAVSYSVFDESEGTWGEPIIVEDDGTADFDPSVEVNGDKIWIAWSNASKIFSEEELGDENFPATLASSCDIVVAEIDPETGNVQTKKVTQDSVYDAKPSISIVDGSLKVAWVSNSGNDPFVMDGQNTIKLASVSEDTPVIENLYQTDHAIASVVAGNLDSKLSVSFVEDEGDGIQASEQMNLKLWQENGDINLVEKGAVNPVFSTINGNDALVWFVSGEAGGTLRYIQSVGSNINDLIENSELLAADYSISENNGKQLILTSGAKSSEDQDGTNLIAYVLSDGNVSDPITLTDESGYVSNATTVPSGNSWTIALLRSDVTVEEERVLEDADLCSFVAEPKATILLQDPSVNEDEVGPGESTFVTVSVVNNGLQVSDSRTISVSCKDEILGTASTGELAPGQCSNLEIPVTLPADLVPNTEIVLKDDGDDLDEQCSLTIGKVNLALAATGGKDGIDIDIQNASGFSTNATVVVRENDEEGGILKTIDLGEVDAYDSIENLLSEDEITTFACDSVYISVETTDEETYYNDNSTLIYTGQDVLKNLDTITASLQTSEFSLSQGIDLSQMVVTANYTDGSSSIVNSYTTNLSDIDMQTQGEKDLVVTYEEFGQGRSVSVPIKLLGDHAHASNDTCYVIEENTDEIAFTCSICDEDLLYNVQISRFDDDSDELKALQRSMSSGDSILKTETIALTNEEGNSIWSLDKPFEIIINIPDATPGEDLAIYRINNGNSASLIQNSSVDDNGNISFESSSVGSFAVIRPADIPDLSVVFDARGGNGGGTQSIPLGDKASDPGDPYMDGYRFTGWFVDEECTLYFDFDDPITESITVYAGWEKVLVSDPDAGSTPDESGDESIMLPPIVDEDGNEIEIDGFDGSSLMVESDFIIEGAIYNSEIGKIVVSDKDGNAPIKVKLTLEDTNGNGIFDKVIISPIYSEGSGSGSGDQSGSNTDNPDGENGTVSEDKPNTSADDQPNSDDTQNCKTLANTSDSMMPITAAAISLVLVSLIIILISRAARRRF